MNFIDKQNEESKKIEELLEITDLNLDYNNGHFTLDNASLEEVGNTSIFRDKNHVVIIQKSTEELALLMVENEKLEYISLALDGSNSINVIRYANHEISKVTIGNRNINLSLSNALTNELDSILKEYKIKFNITKPKNLDFQELTFDLPTLIEENSSESSLFKYIPICKSVMIHDNRGTELETKIGSNNGTSVMRTFNINPSLLKNSLLPKYKINNEFEVMNMEIDPIKLASISYALKPLRARMIKELYELLINAETGGLKRYYLRYFDDVINGINYFQNEDRNDFYVFEDDIKKLQVK